MAWRNRCLNNARLLATNALWCCGQTLGVSAFFLQYELGWLNFVSMRWEAANRHLMNMNESEEWTTLMQASALFPHKAIYPLQLAGCLAMMDENEKATTWLHKMQRLAVACNGQNTNLDDNLIKLSLAFIARKSYRFLAFETIYLLKEFSRLSSEVTLALQKSISDSIFPIENDSIETLSGLMLLCALRFYEGPPAKEYFSNFAFSINLLTLTYNIAKLIASNRIPNFCSYVPIHALYWCGRLHQERGEKCRAIECIYLSKKIQKKHQNSPFNILPKLTTAVKLLL
eukprot:GHVL01006801.1.p1 GENE.GHVL01006801.1~~GHVL01006801.1.p1  ORF type:complete len:286 (+),score=26.01 GHVL01006801.1:536-1393(+)